MAIKELPTGMRRSATYRAVPLAPLALVVACALWGSPAQAAKGHPAMEVRSTECFGPTQSKPWGGISVSLRLDKTLPPEGEPYLIVVDDADGREVDRFSSDTRRYRPTFRIAADGLSRTPDLVITASVGGDVLGTSTVSRNCGTLNPDPTQAPTIEAVAVVDCAVSVTVANPEDAADTILVALWLVGSDVAPMRAVDVAGRGSGVVVFEAQVAGTYAAEAESATTFLDTRTPFDIVVPADCNAA